MLLSGFALLAACSGGGVGGDEVKQSIRLTATAVTPSEVTLQWTAYPAQILGYDLSRDGQPAWPTHLMGLSFTDGNLQPFTRYCYEVRAVDLLLGTVARSNSACVTTPATTSGPMSTIDGGRYPALALDAQGAAHVSYLRTAGGLYYATDTSGAWVTTLIDANAGRFMNTSIAVDPQGAAHIAYSIENTGQLYYSTNASGAWVTTLIDARGEVPTIAIDINGKAHVVYSSGYSSFYLMYANNVSAVWQSHLLVGHGNTIQATDIHLGAAGEFRVASAVSTLYGCAIIYGTFDGTLYLEEMLHSAAACGVSLALDSNDRPHLAYMVDELLVHAVRTNSAWTTAYLDTLGWLGGEDVSLAIDELDKLHVSYQDHNRDLKYVTDRSGNLVIRYLDSAGDVGTSNSLQIRPDGRASIAYVDNTQVNVKFTTTP